MVKFIFFIENRKICDEVECLTDHLCICFYAGAELINFQEGKGKFFHHSNNGIKRCTQRKIKCKFLGTEGERNFFEVCVVLKKKCVITINFLVNYSQLSIFREGWDSNPPPPPLPPPPIFFGGDFPLVFQGEG